MRKTNIIPATLLVLYVLVLLYLVFISPSYGRGYMHRNINLIPFSTIIHYRSNITMNILGNIAAFIPMGFLLPYAFNRFKKPINALLAALFASIFIEIIQYIAGIGVSDIDDILLNTLGGVIGFGAYYVTKKHITNSH